MSVLASTLVKSRRFEPLYFVGFDTIADAVFTFGQAGASAAVVDRVASGQAASSAGRGWDTVFPGPNRPSW